MVRETEAQSRGFEDGATGLDAQAPVPVLPSPQHTASLGDSSVQKDSEPGAQFRTPSLGPEGGGIGVRCVQTGLINGSQSCAQ